MKEEFIFILFYIYYRIILFFQAIWGKFFKIPERYGMYNRIIRIIRADKSVLKDERKNISLQQLIADYVGGFSIDFEDKDGNVYRFQVSFQKETPGSIVDEHLCKIIFNEEVSISNGSYIPYLDSIRILDIDPDGGLYLVTHVDEDRKLVQFQNLDSLTTDFELL
jgi:hypothetical protein